MLANLSETERESFDMFQIKKLSMADVCKLRNLKESTITRHLSSAIKIGLPIDIDRLDLNQNIIHTITDVIRKPPISSGIFL